MPLDSGKSNYQGRNFAPVQPLKDAKAISNGKAKSGSSVQAFLRELWEGLSNEYEAEWQEIIEQGRVISHLAGGKLIMKRDLSGGYVFFKPLTSNTNRSNAPLFAQNCEIHKSKWKKIKPHLAAKVQGDGYRARIQADLVSRAVQCDFERIFDDDYELNEAISGLEFGTYITQFGYDDKLNQMRILAPIVQEVSKVVVDGYGACLECMHEGHPDQFTAKSTPYPQCPECGSSRTTNMVPDTFATDSEVVDTEEIVQGDIWGKLREVPACRWDPRHHVQNSDFFLHSERVPLRLIHSVFGEGLQVDTDSANDIGLRVIDALSMRGGSTETLGENDIYRDVDRFREEGVLRNMYLKPAMYAGFKLENSEKTLAGTIPAGVDWAELFPRGLCVRGYNDMRLIVGLHHEPSRAVSSVFYLQSFSGIGKGVADAVDLAKDMNELYSMVLAGIKRYGAPGLVVDEKAGITQEQIRNMFRPNKVVQVDTSQLPGMDINKAVMQVTPPVINAAIAPLMVQVSNMLSLAFMTGDFASGSTNDVDINTLGGQELATAKAEEQKEAVFGMKAYHRMECGKVLTEIRREHIKIPKYYTSGQDRQGVTKGKFISSDDMPETVSFAVVPETDKPFNSYQKRIAKRELIQQAGGLVGLIEAVNMDQRLASWAIEGYGVELPNLSEEEIQVVCLARLENIKELSGVMMHPDEIIANLDKPLFVDESGHLLKADFISEFLDDDEVQSWNELARMTVQRLIVVHKEKYAEQQLANQMIAQKAQAMLAQQAMATQMAVEQPMIDRNKAMADASVQQQMGQQAAMAEEEQQNAAVADVAGRVMDDEQNQVNFDREQEAADRQLGRDMKLEKAKAQAQAQSCPKPAGGKK